MSENIMTSIETIKSKLQTVKETNRDLQVLEAPGSSKWIVHDAIDDRLHEVLVALGQ